jgi:hypothetical protein
MPAASKAKAASWVRPVACSFLPVCMGAGWWEKGFSGSGTSCISVAKSDRLPARQLLLGPWGRFVHTVFEVVLVQCV